MPLPAPTVLYVEDDIDDVFFLRRALRTRDIPCQLQSVSNVDAAKSYLVGKVPYNDRVRYPSPALVVTDMTMRGSGPSSLDLVSWIRSRTDLVKLPIICATGNEHAPTLAQFARLDVLCHPKTSHMTEIADAVALALQKIHPA